MSLEETFEKVRKKRIYVKRRENKSVGGCEKMAKLVVGVWVGDERKGFGSLGLKWNILDYCSHRLKGHLRERHTM